MKFAIKSGLLVYRTTYPDLIPDFSRPRPVTPDTPDNGHTKSPRFLDRIFQQKETP